MAYMSEFDIKLIVDSRSVIGESPLWVKEDDAVYWIDVKAPALHRTDFGTCVTKTWILPSDIGGYALKNGSTGAIVGLRSGIFDLDFASGELKSMCPPPFDPSTHRFNEGDCDRSGRLWLGTMYDPADPNESVPSKGSLYSFTIAGGLINHHDYSLLHNGFAWNKIGDEFLCAHSREGRIYAYRFDGTLGNLGAKRVFAEVPSKLGIPDGGAFDEEGFYWCAIHRGGRLHRYAPDGSLKRVVKLPIRNPTMVVFCGNNLSELWVTSASHGKPGNPHEGGIFGFRPGVGGLARQVYIS